MTHLQRVMVGSLVLATTAAIGQMKSGQKEQSQAYASTKQRHAVSPDRGQEVFKENCSRCHNAPEGFPPSISGTNAMHMRVRASLSEADYKALLRFLSP